MLLRHLSFLTALVREKHFARAAAACEVSQPTLSAAIRQLEEELGVEIVVRGNRFRGLTVEGDAVVAWARRTLAEHEALLQRLRAAGGELTGRLRLGVVPTAAPAAIELARLFAREHPRVVVTEASESSTEISRALAAFELDCAITYLGTEPLGAVRMLPLYDERYVLVTPRGGAFDTATACTWREAATLPLCLQDRQMQNRRILDEVFTSAESAVVPRLETNSIFAVCAHVRGGYWSSIVPRSFAPEFAGLAVTIVPMVGPELCSRIGLVAADRDLGSPVLRAFWEAAEARFAPVAVPNPVPAAS